MKSSQGSVDRLGFEDKLWAAADKLRGQMAGSEGKNVLLGLIFLKSLPEGGPAGDREEYTAGRIFRVPEEARWSFLQAQAGQPAIGDVVDRATEAIERENPSLRGVLPKGYSRPELDKVLGELVDLVSTIGLGPDSGLKEVLGRVHETFAAAEGKRGELYTPLCVVKLLVELIEPLRGRLLDPCCGSGGMLVSSERFALTHGGRKADLALYGQESNESTWRLAKLNLAIQGIDADLGPGPADSFHRDLHPDLKADFVLANPPFGPSKWGDDRLREDPRWIYGTPPIGNANYAWIQHFLYHLSPRGIAGFVMGNGSLFSQQPAEAEIRKRISEAGLVDCIVGLPGQLFYATGIPVCLWLLARDKENGRSLDRRGEALFIDARGLGTMTDRVHRELTEADIARITHTYHAWRGEGSLPRYADVPGFCKSASLEEIRQQSYMLTPDRYVGSPAVEAEEEPFEARMKRVTATLREQTAEAARLDAEIWKNLERLGYGKP